MPDQQRFRDEDLVLRVSTSIDPKRFDINLYEPFIDALCGPRDYQKESIRAILRCFRDLAKDEDIHEYSSQKS